MSSFADMVRQLTYAMWEEKYKKMVREHNERLNRKVKEKV